MAYNEVVGITLLIGGRSETQLQDYLQDAWTWDGAAWTKLNGAPKLDFAFASYDQARRVVVVFGWGPTGPQTWTWNGATWVKKVSAVFPMAHEQAAICFDRSALKVLLYGGVSTSGLGGVSSETWLWDGSAWSQARPEHSPGPRFAAILVCGPQTVMFGGLTDQYGKLATGTWVWDGSDWRQVAFKNSPHDCCGSAVFDGTKQLLFETGHDGVPVWSWNGSDWANEI